MQLPPKDLGFGQAAVIPAPGPEHSDMSKFPLSSVPQLQAKHASMQPNRTCGEIDTSINIISCLPVSRMTYFVLRCVDIYKGEVMKTFTRLKVRRMVKLSTEMG